MIKRIQVVMAASFVLFAGYSSQAQITLKDLGDLLGPVGSATNHQVGGGFLYNETTKKPGAFLDDRYNFNGSTYFGAVVRLQGTLPNTVDGVAGTIQAQLPVVLTTNLFGSGTKITGSPFTGAGLMTHWSGYGAKNGSAEPVIDTGFGLQIGSHWEVRGQYEVETISNYKLWMIGPHYNLGLVNSGFLGIFGHRRELSPSHGLYTLR
jgi:hypothetical protein